MKNTKNFILVGATLLFSALSTCAFAQFKDTVIDPPPPENHTLKWDMNILRQQWDSLYLKADVDNLAKSYTEVVFVRKPDGSFKARTRAQIKHSFNNKFAAMQYLSYSSQQTDAVLQSDGTIRVTGTIVGVKSDSTQITGTYDRNVILVDGKYKICKSSDTEN